MRARGTIFGMSAALLLGGCSNNTLISAEPLSVTPSDLIAAASTSNKREYLGRIVYESKLKCSAFLTNLVSNEGSINTFGDILSGTLSGVAGFTTIPLAASKALSGAATIVTGAKSAINSDFYAKASIANFETAIQQSYFKNMDQYASSLQSDDESSLLISVEVAKIQTIHASCGIGPAEASIQATIAPQGASDGGAPGGGAPGGNAPGGAPPAAPPAAAPAPRVPVIGHQRVLRRHLTRVPAPRAPVPGAPGTLYNPPPPGSPLR